MWVYVTSGGLCSAAADPALQSHRDSCRDREWIVCSRFKWLFLRRWKSYKARWQALKLRSIDASVQDEQSNPVQGTRGIRELELSWRAHTLSPLSSSQLSPLSSQLSPSMYCFREAGNPYLYVKFQFLNYAACLYFNSTVWIKDVQTEPVFV